jgi:hypothetical protein
MAQRRYALASPGSRVWHVIYLFAGNYRTVCGREVNFHKWIAKGVWRDSELAHAGRTVCGSCARMKDADTMAAARGKVRA